MQKIVAREGGEAFNNRHHISRGRKRESRREKRRVKKGKVEIKESATARVNAYRARGYTFDTFYVRSRPDDRGSPQGRGFISRIYTRGKRLLEKES